MPVSLGRPEYHVVAQRGWMNDPCAPGYDASTGLFHLMYQWNPYSHLWDNISWGAATSSDLVSWTYSSSEPIITPKSSENEKGIFTGSMVPTAIDGGPGLSIFYTCATHLPIHWSQPHTRGAEGVSVITSSDGGKTWIRHPQNPIVIGEPDDLEVTGFRDPSIFEWPALGEKVGSKQRLAVVSGGVQGDIIGPRMFLFGVDSSNLTSWSFLKTLGTMKRNVRLDSKWSGDFGTNWECGNFISLKHDASGLERMIGFVGVEGGHVQDHVKSYRKLNPGRPERDVRYCNWFFANLADDNDIDINFDTTGMMDSGEWYAPSVFLHPDGRRIAWGWIVEQDISEKLAAEKGWIGCLGIPRELSLGVYEGVIGTCRTSLAEITSVEVIDNQVLTLDIRPLRELENLRRASLYNSTKIEDGILVKEAPDCYELLVRADVTGHGSISLKIRESESVQTTISFNTRQEELIIHRDASTLNDGICLQDEIAALTLFRHDSHFEPLELRVFVDKDVVEVFANGRVAIATRIYGPEDARSISIAHEGDLRVAEIQAWAFGGIGLTD